MLLEFNNYKFDKYNLSFNLLNDSVYVIYSKDQVKLKELLFEIAGINKINKKHGTITYKKEDVFDNKEYFKSRIFFDMHYNYLNTISPSLIKDTLNKQFNIDYDDKIFKRKLLEQNVRKEVKVDTKSEFTSLGLSLANYSLLSSIQTDNIIIYDIFHNIEDDKKREYIANDIVKSKFKSVIITTDKIDNFLDKKVRFIVLSEFGKVYILSSENKFIVTENDEKLQHRIFKLDNNRVICLKEDEENIKKGLFKSPKKKEISLKDFTEYGYYYEEK